MDWNEVEAVIESYQDALEAVLVQRERPMPVGVAISKVGPVRYSIARAVGTRPLMSADDVRSFADCVRHKTYNCDAAGVVAIVPRVVAEELLELPHQADLSENVAMSHVEHITLGTRTKILAVPYMVPLGRWGLVQQGIRSSLPPFIDNRRYATGGTA
jgi:hypothetical protein